MGLEGGGGGGVGRCRVRGGRGHTTRINLKL